MLWPVDEEQLRAPLLVPPSKKRNLLSDAKTDSSSKWIRRVLRQRWMSSKRKYTERAKRKDQMSRERESPSEFHLQRLCMPKPAGINRPLGANEWPVVF